MIGESPFGDLHMPSATLKLSHLTTEGRNPRSLKLDMLTARQIVGVMHREDATVLPAIRRALPQISRAVEVIADRLSRGGRLFYVGAGTSGRIGILDAVECVPTFNTKLEQVQGVMAGGYRACYQAIEASEDDAKAGARDLRKRRVTRRDVVVGISASGRTPYTCGALKCAKRVGAKTIAVVNSPRSKMKRLADITIEVITGPEVITGSTRLKAGTAQKMVCNMLSTASMVRLGAVYSNWMINVHMKNRKLISRGVKILREITNADERIARKTLAIAGNDLKIAAVMLSNHCEFDQARLLLKRFRGNLRAALSSRTKNNRGDQKH